MFGLNADTLAAADAEVFVLMKAFDEASSQTVHSRTSYKPREIEFGVRYQDMFVGSGRNPTIDVSALSEVTPV